MSSLEAGLIGLPNSGKSTVFNALTGAGAAVAPHMFSTVETNHAEADVRDPRLADLARLSASAKIVPATLRVVDIAGLVRGASHGEGLGNQFLGQIRSTDAVLHVVRCFRDETVAHPAGSVDPMGDVETVELELAFADLAAIERRYERVAKAAKGGDRDAVAESAALEAIRAALEAGRPARSAGVEIPASVDLLTAKPTLYLANVDDSGNGADVAAVEAFAAERGAPCIPVNAQDRGGAARAARRRCPRLPGRPRDRVARARPPHAGDLRAARPDPLLHDRRPRRRAPGRSGADRTRRPRPAASTPTSPADSSARRSSSGTGWSRPGRRSRPSGRGWIRVEGRDYVVADGDVLNVRFNV